MNSLDDQQLIMDAGGGDRDAFRVLVDRHYTRIFSYVQRYLGSTDFHAVEDLTQDVFLSAWKAAPSYRPEAKVSTWLLKIATNASLNLRRDSRLRATLSLSSPVDTDMEHDAASEQAKPESLLMANEQSDAIKGAIESLPPKQKAAILLRHFDDLSYAEIAKVLDTSVSSVESLIFRARQTLRLALEEKVGKIRPQVSLGSSSKE
jgi:RNA polymerase sigma-70 factor (ECF subfamily)